MKTLLSSLQQILREQLNLPEYEIDMVVEALKEDWAAQLALKTSDKAAAEILEEFLEVTPFWVRDNT